MTDTTQPSPSTSLFDWPIDVPVHEAVFEALGLASMCWEPRPIGVFDSTLAVRVGDELVDLLRRKLWTDEPAAGRSVSGGEA